MKRARFSFFVLALAISGFLFAFPGAASARSYYEPGEVLIRFSPTLGINVGLTVKLDGRNAGAITKGHVYRAYLSPGRHVIAVSRNGRLYDESRIVVDVRPGDRYSFLAKHRANEMVLVPARGW